MNNNLNLHIYIYVGKKDSAARGEVSLYLAYGPFQKFKEMIIHGL